jgi:hypothetical protein
MYQGAPACETAQLTTTRDNQGRSWELYWLGNDFKLTNQIRNQASYTRTHPGWILADSGLCQWQGPPPVRIESIAPAPVDAAPPMPMGVDAGGGDGAMGLLLLLGMAGAGVWAWCTRDKSIDLDYHPMADAPPLPALPRTVAVAAAPVPTQGNTVAAPLVEVVADRHRPSQASNDAGFAAPWDEPSSAVIGPSATVSDDTMTLADDTVTGHPYGFDKLKGISLKQFKDQLAKQGVTPESGAFKSVELLEHPGTALFVERRMMAFWVEFASRRLPHAIYFVFGLQDGGNRSPEFKEQYEQAKAWVTNWFKETLPDE